MRWRLTLASFKLLSVSSASCLSTTTISGGCGHKITTPTHVTAVHGCTGASSQVHWHGPLLMFTDVCTPISAFLLHSGKSGNNEQTLADFQILVFVLSHSTQPPLLGEPASDEDHLILSLKRVLV